MALVRNFCASTGAQRTIVLSWDAPLNFNDQSDEIVVTKTTSHFPVELFNPVFPDRATDSRPVEIYRGSTIVGEDTANISVVGNVITDTGASFPTSPSLAGRLLRDSNSKVFRIVSNTATTITLDDAPQDGSYLVLPDFPVDIRSQENFEFSLETTAGPGTISNLFVIENGSITQKTFVPGELANLLFQDSNGDKFFIKNNTESTITLFTTDTPVLGPTTAILNSFFDSQPLPYVDNYLTESEAAARSGSQLLDQQFYYYTSFNIPVGANVAQAEFATTDSGVSTQDFAISTDESRFAALLYSLWSSTDRQLDETGDLDDLMKVFGFQLNEVHAMIDTYRLQDGDNVLVTALQPLSEQTGLPSVGLSIGADTLRRIANEMIPCWKLKGTKDGIAVFIRKITTWDITAGDGDTSGSIQDFLPNVSALRFFDPNLGSLNVRLTETAPFVAGGRFAQSLPGIVIPGFFTFREFVIDIPNVALHQGSSTAFGTASGTTTLTDTDANFGANDSLVGNFLLPNTEEVNDIFEIVGNTATTITVRGSVNNRNPGGEYAVLSPLNANRFSILNSLLPVYIPFGTRAGFRFITV